MNQPAIRQRNLVFVVLTAFGVLVFGPVSPVSPALAAPSSDTSLIKKLKRQIASLKRQLNTLKRPVPQPVPFIEMVAVGGATNAADPADGDDVTSGVQRFGAVPYDFKIGKFEITLEQYTVFLNAVAAADPHFLFSNQMETNPSTDGINQTGTPGSFAYAVMGTGTRPASHVDWFDAARFCNWLHNGRPTGAQDGTTTERGAYTLDGKITGGLTIKRNPGARFWIPSEDEWYKAAYHQPAAQGGDTDNYWLYPTRSNASPGNTIGPLPLANHANFKTTVFSVTQTPTEVAGQSHLTEGGSYPGSASFFGTFDQGGNVFEWNESVIGSDRGLRGGAWENGEDTLQSARRLSVDPSFEFENVGFRVASP